MVHILLVEDEASHAELIRRAFKSRPGQSSLTIVRSLREAQGYLAESSPDLVIVDLLLPDGKGIDLLQTGQEQASFPAILMTSHGNEQLAVLAMKAGALDYVVKSEVTLADMPRIAERALREWNYVLEHKRAEQEIRQRNRELALLNQVIAVSATSLEPKTILETVCRELAQTLDLPQGLAVSLNKEETALVVVAEYLSETRPSLLNRSIPLADIPFVETIVQQRQPLIFEDAQNDPRLAPISEWLFRRGVVSVIMFPLIVEDRIAGGLCLEATEKRSFSTEEIRLVRSVAEQVAGGLARTQLAEERRRLEAEYYQAQKMESVGRLAAGIAHDFNNLLTGINGFAELLQGELLPDHPHHELVGKILDAGQRAANLVRQLLAFSRKQPIEPQAFNLNANVTKMDQMLRRIIGEDIKLETMLAPNLWLIKADPTHIEQVIINLAVNARDAMPRGGRLMIETNNVILDKENAAQNIGVQPGNYVLLTIADSGHGMSQSVQEHIFEPFFTTKEVGKGTGLGLATTFGIVKQNGGNILVESEEGLGAIFKVYLPGSTETHPSPLPPPEVELALLPGQETILVVEDDAEVRGLTRRILQKHGYTLLEVQNGQEALQLVARYPGPIHLVLTDMIMPGSNGKVVAEELIRLRPTLKVIFMSGYNYNILAEAGPSSAGRPFLQKPFTSKTLIHKIRTVLDS